MEGWGPPHLLPSSPLPPLPPDPLLSPPLGAETHGREGPGRSAGSLFCFVFISYLGKEGCASPWEEGL